MECYLHLLVIQLLKLVLVLLNCLDVIRLISGAAPLDGTFILLELDSYISD
jgi:hypothetical protein